MPVKNFLDSSTLRIAWVFGLSGLGFAGSNLLLARVMDPAEFGSFALVLALIQVGVPVGPAGIDVLINRHRIKPAAPILLRVGAAGMIFGSALVLLGLWQYRIEPALLALLFISSAAGATNWAVAAYYQSTQRFTISLWLSQNQNLVLVIAAMLVISTGWGNAWVPATIVATGYVISAAIGAVSLLRSSAAPTSQRIDWREGLIAVGGSAAGLVMTQLDRLVIPSLLDLEQLATFAILAATVGAPFRILQLGARYAMIARIRAAETVAARWQVLYTEGTRILPVAILSSIAIWFVAPWVVTLFVGDKYELGPMLVLAAVISGFARVIGAFAGASVTAVANQRQLFLLTLISWMAILIGVIGAIAGARWGLEGVVFGVAAGWAFRAFGSCLLLPVSIANPQPIGQGSVE